MSISSFFLLWYEEFVPKFRPQLSATFRIARIITYRSGLNHISLLSKLCFLEACSCTMNMTSQYRRLQSGVNDSEGSGGTHFVILFSLWMVPQYGSPLHCEDLRRLQRSAYWPASLMRQRSCREDKTLWTSISRCTFHACKRILDYVISCRVRCLKNGRFH
jgi:hypothetical protein